ncbi:unnamed protein product [Meloidogyne enterolobii]|uniref:Uncharacterized protein n=1 Tax=Meloidogyne enterolobii TaxID=390850 RepID=A0ACB1AQ42_MELEN
MYTVRRFFLLSFSAGQRTRFEARTQHSYFLFFVCTEVPNFVRLTCAHFFLLSSLCQKAFPLLTLFFVFFSVCGTRGKVEWRNSYPAVGCDW